MKNSSGGCFRRILWFCLYLPSPLQSTESLSVCPSPDALRDRNGCSDRVRTCISVGRIPYRVFSCAVFFPYPTLADAKELDEDEKRQLGCSRAITTREISCTTKIPMENTASLWWTSIGFTSGKQPCRTACARSHSSPVSAFHNWPPLSAGIATFVIGT